MLIEEDHFRIWAFHIFYRRSFREERDRLLRFAKALLASARPIRRPDLLDVWRGRRGRVWL